MATAQKSTSKTSGQKPREGGSSSGSTKKSTSATKRTSAEKTASAGKGESAEKSTPAMKVARAATQQLVELTGRAPECVIGIDRDDEGGWQVDLEVVESRRIPDSTDVLAIYRVQTDEDGGLTGYHRIRRYIRGKSGDGNGEVR